MYFLLFICLMFLGLVIVGIKYDQIVPPFLKLVRNKRVNIGYLLLGVFFFFVGFIALSEEPGFKNFAPGVLSSEEWGFPVHNGLWFIVCITFGIISIISALIGKSKNNENKDDSTYSRICISCGKPIKNCNTDDLICPKCGGKIEDVKGVMDRHPDLLKKVKKEP